MSDDKMRELMMVIRQALLMIVAHIERMYDLKPNRKTGK